MPRYYAQGPSLKYVVHRVRPPELPSAVTSHANFSGRAVGEGPARAVLRQAVMLFVQDKTLYRFDAGDGVATLILTDFSTATRLANIRAAGLMGAVHSVHLNIGPGPMSIFDMQFAMGGRTMNAIDPQFIRAHDPTKYENILPWYLAKPSHLHRVEAASELGLLLASCELNPVSLPTSS